MTFSVATFSVALRLGRVSNLPTVWSNVLAGTVLAGGQAWSVTTLLIAVAVSALYVGGMYLNDAFDREIDARERPERPIPAGQISANTVFAAGFGLLLAGIGLVAWASARAAPQLPLQAQIMAPVLAPVLASVALAAAILFYNWDHKGNVLSPLFMGLCRVLAYITAGYAASAAPAPALYVIALVSLSYLIGLTYIAKQEALDQLGRLWPLIFLAAPLLYGVWQVRTAAGAVVLAALAFWIMVALSFLKRRAKGDVPRAVVSLIAGIALVDAVALASAGANMAALAAVLCFFITLALQRWISGT